MTASLYEFWEGKQKNADLRVKNKALHNSIWINITLNQTTEIQATSAFLKVHL